jgi:hypothetical protein
LVQSGFLFYKLLTSFLQSYGLTKSPVDPCLFHTGSLAGGTFLGITSHVDDVWVYCSSPDIFNDFNAAMATAIEVTPAEPLTRSLGVSITTTSDRGTVSIDQREYVAKMIERWGMTDAAPATLPLSPSADVTASSEEEHRDAEHLPYRSLVGALNWAVLTTPEIAYAVSVCARHAHRWSHRMFTVAKGILRYLKSRPRLKITYSAGAPRQNEITVYCDSNYADDETRKSTSCHITFLNGGVTNVSSRRMARVAKSTCDAETNALATAAADAVFQRSLLHDIGVYVGRPDPTSPGYDPDTEPVARMATTIFCDNQATVLLVKRRSISEESKHIAVRQAFLHYLSEESHAIKIVWVPTRQNLADIGTKALAAPIFNTLRHAIYNGGPEGAI